MLLPAAAHLARDLTAREALSALPDAPVRPEPSTVPAAPRGHRTRARLSAGLLRLSERVAPAGECSPVR
jgi:hypothetical protein